MSFPLKNPFTTLQLNACEEFELPAFAAKQNCTSYSQLLSQVCGIMILPINGNRPSNWLTTAGWQGVIDNEAKDTLHGKYLVGIGSFLPSSQVAVNLCEGRDIQVRDRIWQLRFKVPYMHDGHIEYGNQLELGFKGFDIWIECLGGRLIGGPEGIRPYFVDSATPFEGNNDSREYLDITMEFIFTQFPAIGVTTIDFDVAPEFWGIPADSEIIGDPGADSGWGYPEV